MAARKLLGLVLFAAVSCGLTFQSQAGNVVNSSFEQGAYKALANRDNIYPTSVSPQAFQGWTVANKVYQFGDFKETGLNYSTDPATPYTDDHGFGFRALGDEWVPVANPTGDYYALLMTNQKTSGVNPISSITTSQTVTVTDHGDIVFDMFLYTDNNGGNNIANAVITASSATAQFSMTISSGETRGFVTASDPYSYTDLSGNVINTNKGRWETVTLGDLAAGEYTLTFSIQNTGSGNGGIKSYFGVDNVRVVPVPAAAYAGLALLGLFPLRKKLMGR